MNIQQAKDYIKQSVKMYLTKDEFGDYRIPSVRQRPIFLIGAPGIGKSAIMEQIAEELDIAIVSYSMTHHTRQSALGLPFISEKDYGGNKVSVSEYTMSEIIASVYDTIEASKIREGILFLDEINCVSETLYPSMLQFLQYKTFGRHKIPEGWVIVTAGNPPAYNRSVREFDVVTLDRLKVLEVEDDYAVFRKYASNKGLHGAIIAFLDSNNDAFYHMEKTPEGSMYVTARGWEDLSEMILLCEENGETVTENLISQYIRCGEIAKDFSAYYDLYSRYQNTLNIDAILDGKNFETSAKTASEAAADERIAITALLIGRIKSFAGNVMETSDVLRSIRPVIAGLASDSPDLSVIRKQIEIHHAIIEKAESAGTLSTREKRRNKLIIAIYEEMIQKCTVKEIFNSKLAQLIECVDKLRQQITNMLLFLETAFSEGSNEQVIAMGELTANDHTARFIAEYGCDEYERLNATLQITDRREELRREIQKTEML